MAMRKYSQKHRHHVIHGDAQAAFEFFHFVNWIGFYDVEKPEEQKSEDKDVER